MGLTWEECGGYVPAMQRGPQDTAQTEMHRLLDLSARQAAANDRLRDALEIVRDKLRVDDPHGLYDLVCNALRPNDGFSREPRSGDSAGNHSYVTTHGDEQ